MCGMGETRGVISETRGVMSETRGVMGETRGIMGETQARSQRGRGDGDHEALP